MIEAVYSIGLAVGMVLLAWQWIEIMKGEKDATN